MDRTAQINRKTNETDIGLNINLDGSGKYEINSGNGFFDHMLKLFSSHSRIDMFMKCVGDTEVDFHHSAEDIGIVLGSAFKCALGKKAGIKRYGSIILPMDEALILCAVDLSGRSGLFYDVETKATVISDESEEGKSKVGNFDTELIEEFFLAFIRNAEITLHIKKLAGKNTHHIIEGVFKAFARAISDAIKIDPMLRGNIPSSKGIL